MALQIQGNSGVVAEVDGTTFRAARVVPKPFEYGAFGHYRYGGFTGVFGGGLGGGSEVFQFRWADATRLCVVQRVQVSACVSTTFFAAGVPLQLDLVKSTAWTAAGGSGTAISPAALLKKRTSMGSSLVASGDMRIATTGALSAGTKTLETLSLSAIVAPCPITGSLNGQIIAPGTDLYASDLDGNHPLTLVQNEGFSIRSVAIPGTGTWTLGVNVSWVECAAF